MNTTVFDPPQLDGAPVLLLVSTPLHPPLAEAVASHVLNKAVTAVWVRQAAVVVLCGQVSTTGGGAGTVNVAWQVVVNGAQVLV